MFRRAVAWSPTGDPVAEYEETVQKSRALRRAAAEAWRFA